MLLSLVAWCFHWVQRIRGSPDFFTTMPIFSSRALFALFVSLIVSGCSLKHVARPYDPLVFKEIDSFDLVVVGPFNRIVIARYADTVMPIPVKPGGIIFLNNNTVPTAETDSHELITLANAEHHSKDLSFKRETTRQFRHVFSEDARVRRIIEVSDPQDLTKELIAPIKANSTADAILFTQIEHLYLSKQGIYKFRLHSNLAPIKSSLMPMRERPDDNDVSAPGNFVYRSTLDLDEPVRTMSDIKRAMTEMAPELPKALLDDIAIQRQHGEALPTRAKRATHVVF